MFLLRLLSCSFSRASLLQFVIKIMNSYSNYYWLQLGIKELAYLCQWSRSKFFSWCLVFKQCQQIMKKNNKCVEVKLQSAAFWPTLLISHFGCTENALFVPLFHSHWNIISCKDDCLTDSTVLDKGQIWLFKDYINEIKKVIS